MRLDISIVIWKKEVVDSLRSKGFIFAFFLPILMGLLYIFGFPSISLARELIPFWGFMAIMVMSLSVLPLSIAEEKEKRTLDAVLVSPASKFDFLLGKGLFGMGSSLIGGIAVIALASLVGADVSWPQVVLGMIIGTLGFVEIGLLMGILIPDQSRGKFWTSIILVLFLILPVFAGTESPISSVVRYLPSYHLLVCISWSSNLTISVVPFLSYLMGFDIITFVLLSIFYRRNWIS